MPDTDKPLFLPVTTFIAILGVAVTFLLIPIDRTKDRMVIDGRHSITSDQIAIMLNIDDDPPPEQIRLKHNVLGNAAICIDDDNLGTLQQYNLKGRYTNMASSTRCAVDSKTTRTEVYTLTIDKDTVLLHLLSDPGGEAILFTRAIDTLHRLDTLSDISLSMFGSRDINGDGSPEVIFSISAGFRLQPRAIYAYDRARDRIIRSPDLGNKVYVREVADISGDGIPELFIAASAFGNYLDRRPDFHDHSSYAFVLDSALRPFLPPIEFRNPRGSCITFPIKLNGRMFIGAFSGDRARQEYALHLIDLQGREMTKMDIPVVLGSRMPVIPDPAFNRPGAFPGFYTPVGSYALTDTNLNVSREVETNCSATESRLQWIPSVTSEHGLLLIYDQKSTTPG